MKTDLSNIHPTIAGALSGALDESYCPHGILATRCPIHALSDFVKSQAQPDKPQFSYLGQGLNAEVAGPAVIRLTDSDNGESVLVSNQQVQALEQFLVAIGWQCD